MLSIRPSDRFPSLRAVGRALLGFASEKARVTYADGFREPNAAAGTSSGQRSDSPISDGGGTRILPSTGGAQATTLGQSAIETPFAPARRRSRGPLLALGVLVAGGGVAAFMLSRTMPGSGGEQALAPGGAAEGLASTPAHPHPAAPPSAATELPHPAPTLPAPSPPPVEPVAAPAPAAERPHGPSTAKHAGTSTRSSGSASHRTHGKKRDEARGSNDAPIID